MSIATLIATHDEDALAALANAGIVKRAKRDLAANKAVIESVTDTRAIVNVGDNTVQFTGPALGNSNCTCSATSVCRHMVLAVLALRAAPQQDVELQTSAAVEINALTEAELRKFAGAEWDKAVTLARISGNAVVTKESLNLSVTLRDVEHSVTFLAGQGMQGAAFKGAKSARRRVVAAAAIVARAQAGVQPVAALELSADASTTVDIDTLRLTQTAIVTLVSAVFQGGSVIAEDAVFDLSITARAQAAPRLTALLRLLVRQARQARAHHIDYAEDRFLINAALTYALTHALIGNPDDTALTGVIRRTYRPYDVDRIIPLGAAKWETAGGSRGLRLHLFAPVEREWYSLVQARGAGMDPGFSPQSVYSNPLWSLAPLQKMIGSILRLRDAKTTDDNQIAPEGGEAEGIGDCMAALQTMRDAGQLFTHWRDLRSDVSKRLPVGLSQQGASVPVMMRPSQIVDSALDEIAQVYRVQALDEDGDAIMIEMPVALAAHSAELSRAGNRLLALCCEAFLTNGTLRLSPLTAFLNDKNAVSVVTFGCDPASAWPEAGGRIFAGLSGLGRKRTPGTIAPSAHAGLRTLCSEAKDVAAEILRFSKSGKLSDVERQARRLEQSTILAALQKLAKEPGPDAALRLAYLVHLTEQQAALHGPA